MKYLVLSIFAFLILYGCDSNNNLITFNEFIEEMTKERTIECNKYINAADCETTIYPFVMTESDIDLNTWVKKNNSKYSLKVISSARPKLVAELDKKSINYEILVIYNNSMHVDEYISLTKKSDYEIALTILNAIYKEK